MDILSSHEGQLHIVAKELMEKEKISGDRFKVLMADGYEMCIRDRYRPGGG